MKQATDILGNVSASVADEIGISRDVKVVMGSTDHQCACIGSGAVRDFETSRAWPRLLRGACLIPPACWGSLIG